MDKTTERIKADAEAYANDRFGEYAGNINDFEYPAWKDCVDIYIAGATAENEHMRPVIEAAEKVAKIFAHKGDHQTCAICQLAKALEQWKGTGKEVEKTDEEKYQQWIKENVTVLGEFDFIVGQKRIYGKRDLRRVYEYLTNPTK